MEIIAFVLSVVILFSLVYVALKVYWLFVLAFAEQEYDSPENKDKYCVVGVNIHSGFGVTHWFICNYRNIKIGDEIIITRGYWYNHTARVRKVRFTTKENLPYDFRYISSCRKALSVEEKHEKQKQLELEKQKQLELEKQKQLEFEKSKRNEEYKETHTQTSKLVSSLRKPDKYGMILCPKCCSMTTITFGTCVKCHTKLNTEE